MDVCSLGTTPSLRPVRFCWPLEGVVAERVERASVYGGREVGEGAVVVCVCGGVVCDLPL